MQLEGLYGADGVLPALPLRPEPGALVESIRAEPSLLWLAPALGLPTAADALGLAAALGVAVSLLGVSVRPTLSLRAALTGERMRRRGGRRCAG